jgi:asparagine synthase (glutamine-hydrolysing)
LRIPPELKTFDGVRRPEKYLLRKAFSGSGVIPESVLWRPKCAFSDGVSPQHRSWHRIVQEFVDRQITEAEFLRAREDIVHCPPVLKESLYYRKIYERFFGPHDRLIPHFWMPRWSDVTDPSARELPMYRE